MYIQWGGGEHKIKAEQYEGIHSNCIHTRKLERFNHACQKCTSQWSEDTFLYVRNVPFRLPWKHADNCACHHRRPLTGMCKQISNVGGKSKADFVTLQNVYKSLLFYTDGKRRKLDFPPLVGWRTSSLSLYVDLEHQSVPHEVTSLEPNPSNYQAKLCESRFRTKEMEEKGIILANSAIRFRRPASPLFLHTIFHLSHPPPLSSPPPTIPNLTPNSHGALNTWSDILAPLLFTLPPSQFPHTPPF